MRASLLSPVSWDQPLHNLGLSGLVPSISMGIASQDTDVQQVTSSHRLRQDEMCLRSLRALRATQGERERHGGALGGLRVFLFFLMVLVLSSTVHRKCLFLYNMWLEKSISRSTENWCLFFLFMNLLAASKIPCRAQISFISVLLCIGGDLASEQRDQRGQ